MTLNMPQCDDSKDTFLVDSHCHLEYYNEEEFVQLIDRCRAHNIRILNNICVDIDEFDKIIKYTQQHDFIYCSLGTHPCHVKDKAILPQHIIEIYQQYPHKIIGLGETGLDFFHKEDIDIKAQQQAFQAHIEAAIQLDLPLIVHMRSAETITHQMLKSAATTHNIRGVIHCFTGTKEFLFNMLDLGFYISIAGIVTFKNAHALQDIVKLIPLDRLLLETDSPYLAPTPMRGSKNEPSFLQHTAQFLAQHLSLDYKALLHQTTINFYTLFNK